MSVNHEVPAMVPDEPIDPKDIVYRVNFRNAINGRYETVQRTDLAEARELARNYQPFNNTAVAIDYVAGHDLRRIWTGSRYETRRQTVIVDVALEDDTQGTPDRPASGHRPPKGT